MTTLRTELIHRSNAYTPNTAGFEAIAGIGWHQPTQPDCRLSAARTVSVVIPAHQVGHSLSAVLDALAGQHHPHPIEVIVVDDASTDDTTTIAAAHPVVTRAVRLPRRHGAGTARTLGTHLATGETVLFLDGDIVLPPHVVTDVAARATDTAVLVGFRHNLPYSTHQDGRHLPGESPALAADHRVTWRPPVGVTLPYSGLILAESLDGRPLDHTRDLLDLGHGARYHDWDLPRMVVTAVLAVPRVAVLDVGGFEPSFDRLGWGMEDTYLGACLIAAGLLVIPLRQAVGYHLDPPDAAAQWHRKLAAWPATLAHYRALLDQPAPRGRTDQVRHTMTTLLDTCEDLR
ncbi:GT2 family glycosyltransferase [Actinoalloteichus hoggarensis]|uniref:Glucosyl-3-phosphoglycerate synthase n=1 Tax=Actinoalloteichus hoggarensis TaxID=1470176 RepID=A0A221W6M0_9PSEU|nr:glycosyltransferase [Actinoalloteichus hoggarensis]ASO21572.1 Glucosyl-3-phosphoglycerate synthase [Actinoalloteichus hoggarensis]MBB5922164.1 GT2 family glycosyltransferase [Actinoalloteichus hoggarensis]